MSLWFACLLLQGVREGTNITRIVVQGPQDGTKWAFYFVGTGAPGPEDHDAFRIDAVTGIISLRRRLDHEQQRRYQVSAFNGVIMAFCRTKSAANQSGDLFESWCRRHVIIPLA